MFESQKKEPRDMLDYAIFELCWSFFYLKTQQKKSKVTRTKHKNNGFSSIIIFLLILNIEMLKAKKRSSRLNDFFLFAREYKVERVVFYFTVSFCLLFSGVFFFVIFPIIFLERKKKSATFFPFRNDGNKFRCGKFM